MPTGNQIPTTPDISNLAACTTEAFDAMKANKETPEPADLADLEPYIRKIESASNKFEEPYAKTLPKFLKALRSFNQLQKTQRESETAVDPLSHAGQDIVGALVQGIDGYKAEATRALQELVSDLYSSFLQSAQSLNVPTSKVAKLAPLVKWGKSRANPHTIFSTSVDSFPVAIVSLPIEHASRDVLAWGALGHETVGHDVLHAYGLLDELKEFMTDYFFQAAADDQVKYWVPRTDDMVSDVMGVLFMGPAAAISLIGWIRAARDYYKEGRKLANRSDAAHPADLLRAYLMAEVVGRLNFTGAQKWRITLLGEAGRDAPAHAISISETASQNVQVIKEKLAGLAKSLVEHPWTALNNLSLSQLDTWSDADESLVARLRPVLKDADKLLPDETIYPAHIAAAAITASLEKDAKLDVIFKNMIKRINALPRRAKVFTT